MLWNHALFICIGACFVQFGVFGWHNNFGLFFHSLRKEFECSKSEAAWIGSLGVGITFFVSPMSQIIMKRVRFQYFIMLSILLSASSLLITSFVDKIEFFPITYSLLWGTGAGFANHAAVVIIQKGFNKKLSLANGIAMSGTGLGSLSLGQLLNWLLENTSLRWTFRIASAIPLLFLPLVYSNYLLNKNQRDEQIGMISNKISASRDESVFPNQNASSSEPNSALEYVPITQETNCCKESEESTTDKNVIEVGKGYGTPTTREIFKHKMSCLYEICDKEIWYNKRYVVFVFTISVYFFGMFIPFVFLIEHARQNNIASQDAQFLISILSIVSFVMKILSGMLLDIQTLVTRTTFFIVIMYVMALSHLIAVVSTDYWHFCMYSIVLGICEGCFVGQLAAVVVDFLPSKEKIGVALGNMYTIISIPVMLGPVIAGKLSNDDRTFVKPFYIATTVSLVGAVLTSTIKLMKPTTDCNNNNNDDNNDEGDRQTLTESCIPVHETITKFSLKRSVAYRQRDRVEEVT